MQSGSCLSKVVCQGLVTKNLLLISWVSKIKLSSAVQSRLGDKVSGEDGGDLDVEDGKRNLFS